MKHPLRKRRGRPADRRRHDPPGPPESRPAAAEESLEVIRKLMERATRYEHLSARAGLQVGLVALAGSLLAARLERADPGPFFAIWGAVFGASLTVTFVEQAREVRRAGVGLWTRPAREILRSVLPALVMALALTLHEGLQGRHQELPGIWMLCYGCGALATSTYAPPVVAALGGGFLLAGGITLAAGPDWSNFMMGLAFGGGHLLLGLGLRRERVERAHPGLTLCPGGSTASGPRSPEEGGR